MHRQQSVQSLRSLRLGAYHFLLNILLAIAGCGLIAAGLIAGVNEWIWSGSAIMAIWAVSVFAFFILSYSWKCPLCLGRLWVKTGCRRHRKAVQSLGISYRLGVATSALKGKAYRCPYCGEPFSTTKARR